MLGKDHLNTQLCRDMLAEIATMLGEDARPGESGVRP